MAFYNYHQNNSGGRFTINDNVDTNVIIEANDFHHANDRAEGIGIYFNGVNDDMDCECCGDRWDSQYNEDNRSENIPFSYFSSVEEYCQTLRKGESYGSVGDIAPIHYLNGDRKYIGIFINKKINMEDLKPQDGYEKYIYFKEINQYVTWGIFDTKMEFYQLLLGQIPTELHDTLYKMLGKPKELETNV